MQDEELVHVIDVRKNNEVHNTRCKTYTTSVEKELEI